MASLGLLDRGCCPFGFILLVRVTCSSRAGCTQGIFNVCLVVGNYGFVSTTGDHLGWAVAMCLGFLSNREKGARKSFCFLLCLNYWYGVKRKLKDTNLKGSSILRITHGCTSVSGRAEALNHHTRPSQDTKGTVVLGGDWPPDVERRECGYVAIKDPYEKMGLSHVGELSVPSPNLFVDLHFTFRLAYQNP